MPQGEEEEVEEEIVDSLPEFKRTEYTPRYVIYVAAVLPVLSFFLLPVLLARYIDVSLTRVDHAILYQYLIAVAVGSMSASITTFITWAVLALKGPAHCCSLVMPCCAKTFTLPASEDSDVSTCKNVWRTSGWQRSKLPRREKIYLFSAYVQTIYIVIVCLFTTVIIALEGGFKAPVPNTKPDNAVVKIS